MAVRSYELIGPLKDREPFRTYLYSQLHKRESLHLKAIELGNELAKRRGTHTRTFEIAITEIYREAGALNGRDTITGEFVQIRVDDTITLVLID